MGSYATAPDGSMRQACHKYPISARIVVRYFYSYLSFSNVYLSSSALSLDARSKASEEKVRSSGAKHRDLYVYRQEFHQVLEHANCPRAKAWPG